jgi:hypothetical protein
MTMNTPKTQREAVDLHRLVRAQCAKAIRDYRAYRKIHPEAFQVWACSERKGAMLLARRINRLLGRPNK